MLIAKKLQPFYPGNKLWYLSPWYWAGRIHSFAGPLFKFIQQWMQSMSSHLSRHLTVLLHSGTGNVWSGTGAVWSDLGRRCPALTRHSGTMSWLELLSLVQKACLFCWLWIAWQLGRVSKRSQGELVKIQWYLKSSCSEHLPGVECRELQTEGLWVLCVWP